MTKISLDFAKKLCPDFRLVQRKDLGRKACMHLAKDREMCMRGNHFLCELVLYKNRSAAKDERQARDAISAARINLMEACPRKYHLLCEKYLQSPAGEPAFLRVEDAFKVARARIDTGQGFQLDDMRSDLPRIDIAKLRAVIRFYQEHPPYPVGSVTCEDPCQFQFEGAWYVGYSDALSNDGSTVIEWKYAQTAYSTLKLARQAAIYLKGFPSASRFVTYRMRKPSYRPKKKGETMAEFEERILEGYRKDGPKKVITKTIIEHDAIDVDGVLRQMRNSFEKVLPAMHQAGMPPNYGSCDLCDFQTVCGEMVGCSTNDVVRELTLRKESRP